MPAMATPEKTAAYTVAWIAALPHERAAGVAMFDEDHKGPPSCFQKNASDPNSYSWGRIGKHNVVLAALPVGEYGMSATAVIAQGLRSSLPHIRIGLLVGIGAGIPGELLGKNGEVRVQRDIRLGDVSVSVPDGTSGGVVQVDLVKAKEVDGEEILERKGHLGAPPMAIRTALSKLQAQHELKDSQIPELLEQAFQVYPKMRKGYGHPGMVQQGDDEKVDVYHAQDGSAIKRESRPTPEIHYGVIASANTLEKSARHRDAVLARLKTERIEPICFEMEAAGLMNSFPCLVIRGICDYADEHKNDDWQRYAAATAAAYGKEFLNVVDAVEVEKERGIGEVLEQLESMHSDVRKLQAQTRTQQQNDVLEWLCPNDYSSQYTYYLNKQLPGTSTWFLQEAKFIKWLNDTGPCALFCDGGPGTGKTIISAVVIRYLMEHKFGPNDAVLYLFCNYKEREEQTLDHFRASLLRQLAASSPVTIQAVEQLYESCKEKRSRPSLQDLDYQFEAALRTVANVYIVIDALDECQTHIAKDLVRRLRDKKSANNIRLLATARDVEEIRVLFSETPSINIVASRDDIQKYAQSQIPQFRESIRKDDGLRESIIEGVVGAAEGMFLLASLHMQSLQHQLTANDVKKTIQNLRTGHEAYGAAYETAMDRVSSQHSNRRNLALRIFAWVVHAKRPLRLLELQHALATQPGKKELDTGDFVDDSTCLSVCAGLVTLREGNKGYEQNKFVRLVHYTTQEYFEDTWTRWFRDEGIAISRTCITYLSFDVFSEAWSGERASIGYYPFLEYARTYWADHVRHSEALWDLEDPQHSLLSDAVWGFLQRRELFTNLYLDIFYEETSDFPSRYTRAVKLAAYYGFIQPMKLLIGLGHSVNATDRYGDSPLCLAASNNHTAMARLLLENGANIDARCVIHGTALHTASHAVSVGVVRLLLEKGANPNVHCGHRGTALHIASAAGSVELVRLLLDGGAKVDARRNSDGTSLGVASAAVHVEVIRNRLEQVGKQDGIFGTTLAHTSVKRYMEIVRMLLDQWADVNAQGALVAASTRGHVEVVRLLLNKVADFNAQGALVAASRGGHVEIVRLLLDEGAEANTPGALVAASARGHVEILRLLLDKGAEANTADALLDAFKGGHIEVLRMLLDEGADINAQCVGEHITVLQAAAFEGNEAMVQLLLDRGGNANIKGGQYGSAVRACRFGNGRIVRMLLNKGADETGKEDYRETAVGAYVQFRRMREISGPRNS